MKKVNNGMNYELVLIDSRKLEVLRDQYQKPLNKKRVAQIVANFDENIANEPKVNFRDGHYFVFDGQHTVAARVLRNGGKPLKIKCKVYRDLTKEQEAILFVQQNGFAATPTPANKLRALLYAGDKEAIALNDATRSVGFILDLDGSLSKNHILCINTCMKLFRRAGVEVYTDALGIIYSAWKGCPESLHAEIIRAVTEFAKLYKGQYNTTRLVTLLSRVNPKFISRKIKTDFERPGKKKYIYPIYAIYNNSECGATLPLKF